MTKDLPENSVCAGVPCRLIKKRGKATQEARKMGERK